MPEYRTPLSTEEKKIIISMREAGHFYSKIAIFIGRPKTTVSTYYQRYQGKVASRPYNQVPYNVINLYVVHKLSIKEIMKETGCSYGGVHGKLTRLGVKMRPKGGSKKGKKK